VYSTSIDRTPHFFLIDKPAGITSFDVIRKLKPFFYEKYGKGKGRSKLKVGHFGTLDPFADGLLLVGTGQSLKLTNFIHEQLRKEYLARGILGQRTLTGDCEGEVVETIEKEICNEDIRDSLESFKGDYLQAPSYFSAVKHEGKPLYEYAREGVFIDKDPVLRNIHKISFIDRNDNKVLFTTCVSTGTYIRKLWEDTCEKLGSIGHLVNLRRTAIGNISVEKAIELDKVNSASDLIPVNPSTILNFTKFELDDGNLKLVMHGGDIHSHVNEELIWLVRGDRICALGKHLGNGYHRPVVNFSAS
jgi:tRNA pseudouridine55 synthase